MGALILQATVFVAVVSSFGLAALVITSASKSRPEPGPHPAPAAAPAVGQESAAETMSRVLADVERLAALRERGVITAKEYADQKKKLLELPS
jgi:hypothetical protein